MPLPTAHWIIQRTGWVRFPAAVVWAVVAAVAWSRYVFVDRELTYLYLACAAVVATPLSAGLELLAHRWRRAAVGFHVLCGLIPWLYFRTFPTAAPGELPPRFLGLILGSFLLFLAAPALSEGPEFHWREYAQALLKRCFRGGLLGLPVLACSVIWATTSPGPLPQVLGAFALLAWWGYFLSGFPSWRRREAEGREPEWAVAPWVRWLPFGVGSVVILWAGREWGHRGLDLRVYYSLVFGLSTSLLGFALQRGVRRRRLWFVSGVIGVCFFSSLGPLSAVEVTRYFQVRRLGTLLREAGVVATDGHLQNTQSDVPYALRERISRSLDYILSIHGHGPVHELVWPGAQVVDRVPASFKPMENAEQLARQTMELLRLEYVAIQR